MKRLLIIGKSFSSLTNYLKEHNYDYVVLRDEIGAKHPEKKFKHRVVCDFSSKESILAAVDNLPGHFDGLFCVYENYVLPTAWIAEHLGLPGMPIEAVEACTDKFIMRQKFAKAPQKISPDFAVVRSQGDVEQFAANHSFPLILKPANLSKSLLVTKNHDLEELLANYQKTVANIDAVYAKYSPHTSPKILIEEFLEGPVHSVDAFIGNDGEPQVLDAVVDYQTGYDIGYDDNFHYSRLLPSKLSTEEIAKVRETASIGCKALGMKNTAAHIEIIRTADGPRIVEIGARNGGYRERMHMLANGIDIIGTAIKVATGQSFKLDATHNESVAVLELFPKKPGKFVGIEQETALRELSSFSSISIKAKPGVLVGKSSDGYKMCAVVFLHNPDAAEFARDLAFVNDNVRVATA